MSKYFAVVDGVCGDFKYKTTKQYTVAAYRFYVGDTYIGTIVSSKDIEWSCFLGIPNDLGVVDGFKTRHRAAEFLIQLYKSVKDRKPATEYESEIKILEYELKSYRNS